MDDELVQYYILILILTSFCGSAILHKDTLFIFRYPLSFHILPFFYPPISYPSSILRYSTILLPSHPPISYHPSTPPLPPILLLPSFYPPFTLPYPVILPSSHILSFFNAPFTLPPISSHHSTLPFPANKLKNFLLNCFF